MSNTYIHADMQAGSTSQCRPCGQTPTRAGLSYMCLCLHIEKEKNPTPATTCTARLPAFWQVRELF